ncbi:endonuclease [Caerostris darwini]|uniref:Endonuclease n=1 Tax=Caerostris darwini TaxID=1538125 RepID=A0AAV4WN64_9ARAC|nr:endonuclease [Caerostris darwini]
MNPIEHLWDIIERSVRAQNPAPSTLSQLWTSIETARLNIPAEDFQRLVESMPRRPDSFLLVSCLYALFFYAMSCERFSSVNRRLGFCFPLSKEMKKYRSSAPAGHFFRRSLGAPYPQAV